MHELIEGDLFLLHSVLVALNLLECPLYLVKIWIFRKSFIYSLLLFLSLFIYYFLLR